MDSQNKSKKINFALKIIIPIAVVGVIAGIWFFKTYQKPQEITDFSPTVTTNDKSQEKTNFNSSITATDEPQEVANSSSSTTTADESKETASSTSATSATNETQKTANADFSLAASEIDLKKLKLYGLPIIIDFGADECIPCKEMAPVLKKLNAEWQGKVIVKFVDVWKYPNAAVDFPLQVIPSQFFFDGQGNPYVPIDPEGMQMIMYSLKDTQEHVYTAHQGGMTEDQIRAVFKEMGIK
ncbi:MAG: thioredoxin family protein [Actinobacteria bacterium]|nr:thioredoxin family protein [Actinomycetota bacterium]MCL6086952.1 thioredoxin family protein [Actinomycetota bacterium]